SPSYTNVDPEKKEDKKGGYKMWCILTGLFAVGGGATLGVMVSQESANTEDLAALGAIAGISTLVALPLCGYAYSK
ncbi:MAG: hypothetical protein HY609_05590, partial [Deltaproteobacteria bacterium]|nr:hypothetical protein [Deltaproteobacteria bacterium]